MIEITPDISLAEDEIEEHFIRSPGSGGQKVNKTETAVQLRFDARHSPALSNAVFLRLKPLAGDCCVFCSYGDVKCPPIQQGDGCCVA